MTGPERSAVLARWREAVTPGRTVARLDMLLWRGLTGEAEAMLPLVDADWQRLAQARIATRRDAEGLQYQINTVPAKLKRDPGLAYERYLYRVEQAPLAGCRGLPPAKRPPRRSGSAGRTSGWIAAPTWPGRRWRTATSRGAYRIAAQNFGSPGRRTTRIPSGWRASSR